MQITDALINKFFDDACTPEEADAVSRYFQDHPAELRRYLTGDWKAANHASLPVKRYYAGWAAAAAVILVAGIVLFRVYTKKDKTVSAATATAAAQPPGPKESWLDKINTRAGKEKITLPDGSVVALFTNSHIRYNGSFSPDRREIFLEGQASFEVKKDEARPFLVKAGATTTTVLGTVFNVFQDVKGVTVRLYKGKVSVRAAAKNIVLSPGEQMKYEAGKEVAEVTTFHEGLSAADRLMATPTADYKKTLTFDNTPLPEVIRQLVRRYRVPVTFDEKEMSRLYFTGSVLRSDSLLTILHVIANMNDLTILPGKEGFMLSVSHH